MTLPTPSRPAAQCSFLLLRFRAALVLIAITGFQCAKERAEPKADPSCPNILLVTFDTTRADHIGAYGWRHARTPVFDRLAEEGIRFERVYAPVPLTLPSHATLMTGLYPFYHGMHDNGAFRLDDGALTLAEILRRHGYQTGAAVAAFVLDHRFGLDQGFEAYSDDLPAATEFDRFLVPYRNANKVVEAAVGWLQTTRRDCPFFLWAHFYDPHFPYLTPLSFPFYQGLPYDSEIAYADFQLGRLLAYLEETPPNDRPTLVVVTADHGESLGQHGEDTHGYFVYDATLAVPLVIRLADGSRAGQVIPAPVSLADVMPTVLDLAGLPVPDEDEIHGRSLAPLIDETPGASDWFAERPIYFECYAPAYSYGWAPVRGVQLGDDKFIESPEPELYRFAENAREGADHNRYALEPEVADRLKTALDELLSASLKHPRALGTPETLDAEAIQQLQALGYVAGGQAEASQTETGADLKAMLPHYTALLGAQSLIGSGQVTAVMERLGPVARADPDNPRCLWLLAEAVATNPEAAAEAFPVLESAARNPKFRAEIRTAYLVNCGRGHLAAQRPDRALSAFRQAAEIAPRNAFTRSWIAVACLHLGQAAEAIAATREATRLAPNVDSLAVQLGLAHICNRQLNKGAGVWQGLLERAQRPATIWEIAERCSQDPVIGALAREALTEAGADGTLPTPVRAAAWAAAGQILFGAGDFPAALRAFHATRDLLGEDDALVRWWVARTLTRLGRAREAQPLLERARQLVPDAVFVVVDLAVLEHQLGNTGAAVKLLSEYHAAHPDDVTAANNLAWILAEQGEDLDRALALAKNAYRHRRSSAAFADTLGWVHIRRGDGESAVYVLVQAVGLAPDNPTYHYHLGLAHRLAGAPDKARAAFARAVELAPGFPRPAWYEEASRRSQ